MYLFAIIVGIVCGVASIYYTIFRRTNFFKSSKIPYLPPLPFFGNMLPVVFQQTSFVEFTHKIYNMNKEAKYVGFYHFSTPILLIRDPGLIKSITIENFDHFMDHHGFLEPKQDPFFTSSTFSLCRNEWKKMRSRLTPAFTAMKLKALFPIASKCAKIAGDHLIEKFGDKPDEIELKDVLLRCTNDVIANCQLGCDLDSITDPENAFYVLGKRGTDFDGPLSTKMFFAISFPKIFNFFNIKLIEPNVVDFFSNFTKEIVTARAEKNIERPDILQIIMDTNKPDGGQKVLTVDEMAGYVFSLYFGAFETTASTLGFAFYEIARNEDVQKKLHAEVDEVMERTGGNPTYEDIHSMEYLRAVLDETMRLDTVAVFVERMCTKAFELPPATTDGKAVMVQPGQMLWIPVHALQRDPKYYPNPDNFDPERFIGKAKDSIASGTYIPFGYGPRVCIGQRFAMFEAMIVAFHFIARCEFSLGKKMKTPFKYSRKSIVPLPEDGFWLNVEVRDSWKKSK